MPARHRRARARAAGVLLALATALAAIPVAAASLAEVLESYVEEMQQSRGLGAALIADRRVEIATAGEAGRSGAPELSRESLFEIGSVTKLFTGLLLTDMARRGEVGLATAIGDLMPQGYELEPEIASVTLRELATHRSGLPRMYLSGAMLRRSMLRFSDPYAGSTKRELFEAAASLEAADLASRGAFRYSNLGVALLGRLLEEAVGISYERLLEERVLSRYDMDATRSTAEVLCEPQLVAGHRSNLRRVRNWRLDAYAPAGGLASNLEDLSGFLEEAMAAQGLIGESLEPARLNGVPEGRSGLRTGLGWFAARLDGEPLYWHNGRTAGYYAFVGFLPESDRGLVLLSNTGHDGDALAMALLRGEEAVPEPDGDRLLWDGFMLLLTALVPLAALGQRWSVAGSARGLYLRPRGRIHLLHGAAGIATMLLITWALGPWNWISEAFWWLALVLAVALLASALPAAARLDWFPARGTLPGVVPVAGTTVNALFILWFAANL